MNGNTALPEWQSEYGNGCQPDSQCGQIRILWRKSVLSTEYMRKFIDNWRNEIVYIQPQDKSIIE